MEDASKYVLDRGDGNSSPSGLSSSGSKGSLSRFFKGFSNSTKRAAASANDMLDISSNAYKDLDGDAPQTKLEKIERRMEEQHSDSSTYSRASRFFFSQSQQSTMTTPGREIIKSDDDRSSHASSIPLGGIQRGSDSYVPMADDDDTFGEESQARKSNTVSLSFVSSVSRASDAVFASLRPNPKQYILEARHSALPYIDSTDYSNQALRKPLSTEPSAIVAARAQAQANKFGSDVHGGLWALKAKLVTLEKDLANAEALLHDAEHQAAEQLASLQAVEQRRDQLKLREARLGALLEQARLLEAHDARQQDEQQQMGIIYPR